MAMAAVAALCLLPGTASAYFAVGGYYTLLDIEEEEGPAFIWDDPAGGNTLTFSDPDDANTTVTIPFSFPFFQNAYTTVGVSTNGLLSFGTNSLSVNNSTIPSATAPNNMIAAFWDDLILPSGGQISTRTVGTTPNRRFVVTWQGLSRFLDDNNPTGNAHRFTFQAALYENGCIRLQYQTMTNNGGQPDYASGIGATVGVEAYGGTTGMLYVYGNFSASPGFPTLFPPGNGLSDSHAVGFIRANTTTPWPTGKPALPTQLQMMDDQGGVEVQPGFRDGDRFMWMRATVSHGDTAIPVAIQVEVKPSDTAFNGVGFSTGNFVPGTGGVSEASSASLTNGDYKWRARTVDQNGGSTPWIEYNPFTPAQYTIAYGLFKEGSDNANNDSNVLKTLCGGGVLATGHGHFLWMIAALAGLLVIRRK